MPTGAHSLALVRRGAAPPNLRLSITRPTLPTGAPMLSYPPLVTCVCPLLPCLRVQGSGYWIYPSGTRPLLWEFPCASHYAGGYNSRPGGCASLFYSPFHTHFLSLLFFSPFPWRCFYPSSLYDAGILQSTLFSFSTWCPSSPAHPTIHRNRALWHTKPFLELGSAAASSSVQTASIPIYSPLQQTHIHSLIRLFSP